MPETDFLLPPLRPEILQQLTQLVDQFQRALLAGESPRLESFLDEVAEQARPQLFRDLFSLEMTRRLKAGNPFTRDEALQRYGEVGPWVGDVLSHLSLDAPEETLLLEVLEGPVAGQNFRLTGHASFFVGRGQGVHLALIGDNTLSRVHFCIEYNPPQACLADCNSKNGTFHNKTRVPTGGRVDLRDGDLIRAGDVLLRIRLFGGNPTVTGVPFIPSTSSVKSHPDLMSAPTKPKIHGYSLEDELGRGGMGVVYRARRLADDQLTAVKVVLPALMPRADTRARFHREVGILEQLEHPNIVRFHETGLLQGLIYFVMEYIEGCSAAQMVKRQGPLPPTVVVRLGCQLLDALGHAHQRGFVHRDVKPGNLLLSGTAENGTLKLADFGLARAYEASAMSGLTRSGQSGGTPEFMPPEQVRDFRAARPAADQYSAAASLYYLLTGQHIYERASSMMDLLVRILQEEPIPLRPGYRNPAMDGDLGRILCRALAREPGDRYPDVQTMRRALTDVRQ